MEDYLVLSVENLVLQSHLADSQFLFFSLSVSDGQLYSQISYKIRTGHYLSWRRDEIWMYYRRISSDSRYFGQAPWACRVPCFTWGSWTPCLPAISQLKHKIKCIALSLLVVIRHDEIIHVFSLAQPVRGCGVLKLLHERPSQTNLAVSVSHPPTLRMYSSISSLVQSWWVKCWFGHLTIPDSTSEDDQQSAVLGCSIWSSKFPFGKMVPGLEPLLHSGQGLLFCLQVWIAWVTVENVLMI